MTFEDQRRLGPADERPHRVMAAVPYILLGASLVLAVSVADRPSRPSIMALVALTAVAVGYRVWWQQTGAGSRVRAVGFAFNLLVTLALVSLSPLYGLYAFVGYLDAVVLFSGPALVPALVAAASLNALAQSGGPAGAYRQPLLFAVLLVANSGLAVAMVRIDQRRQLTVSRLRQTLVELDRAQRINDALQEQLVEQARASGVLDERQRLSREIHDTVAQGLIAILRQVEAASEATEPGAARVHLDRADHTARESLAEARRAVQALASPQLDHTDLTHALRGLVTTWSDRNGVDAAFTVTGTIAPTPHDADLLRVGQEALANVAKHAAASRVDISLAYHNDEVRLEVHDDGVGLNGPATAAGHGVPGMRARLRAAGGTLALSSDGGGCTLCAVVPR